MAHTRLTGHSVLGFFAALVVASLALPIEEWRTGETRLPALH